MSHGPAPPEFRWLSAGQLADLLCLCLGRRIEILDDEDSLDWGCLVASEGGRLVLDYRGAKPDGDRVRAYSGGQWNAMGDEGVMKFLEFIEPEEVEADEGKAPIIVKPKKPRQPAQKQKRAKPQHQHRAEEVEEDERRAPIIARLPVDPYPWRGDPWRPIYSRLEARMGRAGRSAAWTWMGAGSTL